MLKFFLERVIEEELLDDRNSYVHNNRNTMEKAQWLPRGIPTNIGIRNVYKKRNKVLLSGITDDLERREKEDQRRGPGEHIVQVGRPDHKGCC
ncbi:hypothetical protein CEE34_09020 [Candidatus Aerophobetes bacterium Ae_b3a]|nr:MAG: hypothetical protein CEE34_09020 [Candidatus Aerophobetes bacterium Ae_b3a]